MKNVKSINKIWGVYLVFILGTQLFQTPLVQRLLALRIF